MIQKWGYLCSSQAEYVDRLFIQYRSNPESVDLSWRYFFEGIEWGERGQDGSAQTGLEKGVVASSSVLTELKQREAHGVLPSVDQSAEKFPAKVVERNVEDLIRAYRHEGWRMADVNPLTPSPRSHPAMELSAFQLTAQQESQFFEAGRQLGKKKESLSLKNILEILRKTYCGSIGVEVGHLSSQEEQAWIFDAFEKRPDMPAASVQKNILKRLIQSECFEHFLHTRYVAQKRFSLEGAESIIPGLDRLLEEAGNSGVLEFVLGMAHRGRLNVLTHLFGKKPDLVFTEFEANYEADLSKGEGDVKYHMGYSTDYVTQSGAAIHLSLACNPSHLEFINPVIAGMVRAKQFQRNDSDQRRVIPIAIHGDAAFSGQGICYETLNLAHLKGYSVGGTLHWVINNQVGFTTNPVDSRSTRFCTDLGKILEAPIFHVNGDDPEAVYFLAELSLKYRQRFKKDVFIDLVCYRRHGHNEADEPAFTQPLLYEQIKKHPSSRQIYAQKLITAGVVSASEVDHWMQDYQERLIQAQNKTRAENPKPFLSSLEGRWKGYAKAKEQDLWEVIPTAVHPSELLAIAKELNRFPSGFQVHPKLQRLFDARLQSLEKGQGLDWGNAEALAFGSLLKQGYSIRLSGQDVERGTFSHRHAVVHDLQTGQKYTPLQHLEGVSSVFHIHNSHLSESAVLGFEYGYSMTDPQFLTIWEAQFGDFANGAQVIIDQFVSTSESKWQRMTGLTLLLPHSYEGQGPEHSSARLERFLQLCGRLNQAVCYPSTPAQIFHLLRRQMLRKFRKPLIVMSPKSLLRHPLAVSSLKEFSEGGFQEVLDDSLWLEETLASCAKVKRVLCCSGKIYYDLWNYREAHHRSDVALVRIEQLYPWPQHAIQSLFEKYSQAEWVWVQEEPENMGAWSYLVQKQLSIRFIGREIAAAPSVGSHKVHEKQQESLVQKAFL